MLTNSFIILYANLLFVIIIVVVVFWVFPSLFPSHLFCWTLPFSEDLTGAKLKKGLNLNSHGNFAFRQGQNDIEDGVHAKVNGGYDGRYADAGPPSANGTNRFVQPQPEQQQQAAAAPPDYAVVDKSKKKNKDKKNGNENIPDYAVVDKSKKKKNKKAEAEDPYAEVEDRKKVRQRSQA